MKKYLKTKHILGAISIMILLTLLFLAASCTPQKRFQRITALHPELLQSKTDTILKLDSIVVKSKAENLDSLLEEYCKNKRIDTIIQNGDTIYKPVYIDREKLVNRCNTPNGLHEKFILENGTVWIDYDKNGERKFRVQCNEIDHVVYTPNPNCPECPEIKEPNIIEKMGLWMFLFLLGFLTRSLIPVAYKLFKPLR